MNEDERAGFGRIFCGVEGKAGVAVGMEREGGVMVGGEGVAEGRGE